MAGRHLIAAALLGLSAQDLAAGSRFTLAGPGFEMQRSITPAREVEITVSGRGEFVPLTIRIGGRDRLRVARASHVVWGLSDPAKVRIFTDGLAVAAFREHIGEYERQLIAGGPSARANDPHGYGFLLAGALIASMAGDPAAGGRARDLVLRHLGQARDAGGESAACEAVWQRELMKADAARTVCLTSANGREGIWERWAERLLCDAEFMAGFAAGEAEFVACRGSVHPHGAASFGRGGF